MGDVAMTVPVIRALSAQYPNVKITVVSRPFFKPFFEDILNVNFFSVDVKGRHKGFLGLLRLHSDLKKLNIDAVADLHNVLRSQVVRILFKISGKKVAFTDKGRADKKGLTRAKNKIFQPVKSMVERHLATFKELDLPLDLTQLKFPNQKSLSENVTKISGEKRNQKWIGIAPFAQYDSKVYPLDLMQEVIDSLALNSNYKLFLFGGGKEETEKLTVLAGQKENVINIAGKIPFHEELQLISHLDIMLSMDSGNSHIAAMLGVNVVTLWGATHPYAGFAPFNQPIENCLVSDREKYPLLPTSIYGNKKVSGYEDVMRTISVERVVSSVQSQLTETGY